MTTEHDDGVDAGFIEQLKAKILVTEAEVRRKANELAAMKQMLATFTTGEMALVVGDHTPQTAEYLGVPMAEAALRFLKECGEAQTTKDIALALRTRGLRSGSKRFIATVYATLASNKSFKRNKKDKTWEVREAKK